MNLIQSTKGYVLCFLLTLWLPFWGTKAVMAASDASYLIVQNAASGTITGPDDQHLILTLDRVPDYVTLFADRPMRAAFATPAKMFYGNWESDFSESAPNAVLTYRVPGKAILQNIVLTLMSPKYDPRKERLTFNAVRIFEQVTPMAPPGYSAPVVRRVKTPKRFGVADLFIDDFQYISCMEGSIYYLPAMACVPTNLIPKLPPPPPLPWKPDSPPYRLPPVIPRDSQW